MVKNNNNFWHFFRTFPPVTLKNNCRVLINDSTALENDNCRFDIFSVLIQLDIILKSNCNLVKKL